ncbi:MAG: hypothetical protein ABIN74_07210 [Ferruginibacter sp.]
MKRRVPFGRLGCDIGTWSGVVDGLRKERKIFVRQPEPTEKNANLLLIQKGAVAVDFNGNELLKTYDTSNAEQVSVVSEPSITESLETKIRSVFNGRPLSANELLSKLGLDWTAKKLAAHLKKLDFIEIIKVKSINQYKLKGQTATTQHTLFA